MWNENDFSIENLSWDKYIEAWKLNIQAFVEISESILNNTHELSSQQLKLIRKNVEEAAKCCKDMTSTTKPEDKIARHADFVKTSVETTINASKELVEKTVKHGTATGEIINKRATEVLSELAKSNQPGAKKEKAKQAA